MSFIGFKPRTNIEEIFSGESYYFAKALSLYEKIENSDNQKNVLLALNYLLFKLKIPDGPSPLKLQALLVKTIETIGIILPKLQTDTRIPKPFKKALTIPHVLEFTLDVIKVNSEGVFRNSHTLLAEYNDIVKILREKLLEEEDPNGLHFHARQDFLFSWCRVLIERTMHPLMHALKNIPEHFLEKPADRKRIDNTLKLLMSTFTKFVLFVVCVDDVADIIRNRDLLDFFMQAPLNSDDKAEIATLKEKIKESYPAFSNLFNFYTKIWDTALQEFKVLLGEELLPRDSKKIITAIQDVMQSMLTSVSLSKCPELYKDTVQKTEEVLSVNMLMTFYKTLENIFLNPLIAELDHDDESQSAYFKLGEYIGHGGNNIATLIREIGSGDLSNTLIVTCDSNLTHWLTATGQTMREYIKALAPELADIPTPKSLLKLLKMVQKTNLDLFKIIIQFEKDTDLSELTLEKMIEKLNQDTTKPELVLELKKQSEIRNRLLTLCQKIFEDPVPNLLGPYYTRISVEYSKMLEIQRDELKLPYGSKYEDGIASLFAMYLTFKSDM